MSEENYQPLEEKSDIKNPWLTNTLDIFALLWIFMVVPYCYVFIVDIILSQQFTLLVVIFFAGFALPIWLSGMLHLAAFWYIRHTNEQQKKRQGNELQDNNMLEVDEHQDKPPENHPRNPNHNSQQHQKKLDNSLVEVDEHQDKPLENHPRNPNHNSQQQQKKLDILKVNINPLLLFLCCGFLFCSYMVMRSLYKLKIKTAIYYSTLVLILSIPQLVRKAYFYNELVYSERNESKPIRAFAFIWLKYNPSHTVLYVISYFILLLQFITIPLFNHDGFTKEITTLFGNCQGGDDQEGCHYTSFVIVMVILRPFVPISLVRTILLMVKPKEEDHFPKLKHWPRMILIAGILILLELAVESNNVLNILWVVVYSGFGLVFLFLILFGRRKNYNSHTLSTGFWVSMVEGILLYSGMSISYIFFLARSTRDQNYLREYCLLGFSFLQLLYLFRSAKDIKSKHSCPNVIWRIMWLSILINMVNTGHAFMFEHNNFESIFTPSITASKSSTVSTTAPTTEKCDLCLRWSYSLYFTTFEFQLWAIERFLYHLTEVEK